MRHCCFTINSPERTGGDFIEWPETVRYAVWQLERGEDGTRHLQGYVEFSRPMSFAGIKRVLGGTAHVEARRGTRDQAREYCRKEATRVGGPWEYGVWIGGAGYRSDIQIIIGALKEGKKEDEILEEFPVEWARHYKIIERYRMIKGSSRNFKTAFHLYLGDAGTGKTRMVNRLSPDGYWKRPGSWYDGYDGEKDLILDEIDKQEISLGELLMITDRYPTRLPVKGGHIGCLPKAIYATSNIPIEQWYSRMKPEELKALIRRIDTMTTYRWVKGEGGDEKMMIKVIKEIMKEGKVISTTIDYVSE